MINLRPNIFEISIIDKQICKIIDLVNNTSIDKFNPPVSGSLYKIYVITDTENILYVGTTKNSIKNRLRNGLKAKGKSGYYGYKWKTLSNVRLFVWCFENFDKVKIESIEAELVFLIRRMTGRWPLSQNEIHFNNFYLPTGTLIAEKLYTQIKEKQNYDIKAV